MPSPLLNDLQFVSLAREYAFAKSRAGETDLLFRFKDSASIRFPSQRIPSRVIVMGGGISACEQAQALAHLGTEVTLVTEDQRILEGHEPLLSRHLEKVFSSQGIRVMKQSRLMRDEGPFFIVEEGVHTPRIHKVPADHILDRRRDADRDALTMIHLVPLMGSFGPVFTEAVKQHGHQALLRGEIAREGLGRVLVILSKKRQTVVAAHAIGKGIDVLLPYLLLAQRTGTPWASLSQGLPARSVLSDWIHALDDEIVLMQAAA